MKELGNITDLNALKCTWSLKKIKNDKIWYKIVTFLLFFSNFHHIAILFGLYNNKDFFVYGDSKNIKEDPSGYTILIGTKNHIYHPIDFIFYISFILSNR